MNDIILGISFLIQIYPFYVDKNSVHTKVLDKTITFAFIYSTNQLELSLLQKSSILRKFMLYKLFQIFLLEALQF